MWSAFTVVIFFKLLLLSNSCYACRINIVTGRQAVVFGIYSSCIVNRKEIVLGFALHYFTPSYLQCSHYLSQILQPAILLRILIGLSVEHCSKSILAVFKWLKPIYLPNFIQNQNRNLQCILKPAVGMWVEHRITNKWPNIQSH